MKKRSYDNRVLQLPKGEVSGENKERDIQIIEKFEINVKSLCMDGVLPTGGGDAGLDPFLFEDLRDGGFD